MVEARMQPLAALLALGQVLEQEAAGEPMLTALLGREPNQARDLLRLRKIALRRLGKVLALERNDALVALIRDRLVEGDREIALTEQLLQRRLRGRFLEPLRIMPHIAAQLAAEIIAHQKVDDSALGLRLQRQLALR